MEARPAGQKPENRTGGINIAPSNKLCNNGGKQIKHCSLQQPMYTRATIVQKQAKHCTARIRGQNNGVKESIVQQLCAGQVQSFTMLVTKIAQDPVFFTERNA